MDDIYKIETEVKSIRMEKWLADKIREDAKNNERNFNQQVVYIIKKYYEIQQATK